MAMKLQEFAWFAFALLVKLFVDGVSLLLSPIVYYLDIKARGGGLSLSNRGTTVAS